MVPLGGVGSRFQQEGYLTRPSGTTTFLGRSHSKQERAHKELMVAAKKPILQGSWLDLTQPQPPQAGASVQDFYRDSSSLLCQLEPGNGLKP